MYNEKKLIYSVGELKKVLETLPDDAKVYACGGSTEDGAVWVYISDNCISLDECELIDDDDDFLS